MEKRPSIYSKEVVALVVKDILPEVVDWLRDLDSNDPCFTEPGEMEHLKGQITTAVDRGYYDAFETAKYLSNNGWEAGGELVDIFDSLHHKAHLRHTEMVGEWAVKNGIKAELAVGDKATFLEMGKTYQGEISEIRETTAEYTIFCEELGHSKTKNEKGYRRIGIIIPFEGAKAVTP